MKDDEIIKQYLPIDEMEQKRFPDKFWMLGACLSIKKDWPNKYYDNPSVEEVIVFCKDINFYKT